jgi:hypothetical protein
MNYALRGHVRGVRAETVVAECERLAKRDGAIVAKTLVNESRPTSAPLHPAFEWNDTKAAEQHRLSQARAIIRSVHVISENGKNLGCAFVHVRTLIPDEQKLGRRPSPHEGSWIHVQTLAQQPDYCREALDELLEIGGKLIGAIEDLMQWADFTVREKAEVADLKESFEDLVSRIASMRDHRKFGKPEKGKPLGGAPTAGRDIPPIAAQPRVDSRDIRRGKRT